jgi:hypothetical protein
MSQPIDSRLILSIIERGLDTLGDNPRKEVWFCLENDYDCTRENVPENLEVFQRVLQNIFGAGYSLLDDIFRQYLEEMTDADLQRCANFVECVEVLRHKNSLSSLESKAITP